MFKPTCLPAPACPTLAFALFVSSGFVPSSLVPTSFAQQSMPLGPPALVASAEKLAQFPVSAEGRAARAYGGRRERRARSPSTPFWWVFPKGADLHVHLSGAVYAETFLRDAAEDGLCVDPVGLKLVPPPCASPLVPAARLSGNIGPRRSGPLRQAHRLLLPA